MSQQQELETLDVTPVEAYDPFSAGMQFDRDEVIDGCRRDLNLLAAICLPEVYQFPFPPIFLAIWQLLISGAVKQKTQEKLAIGLPRGFGKTIFLKLYVIWLILYTDRKFIIIVCNVEGLAVNFLADVLNILSSPNVTAIWGDFRKNRNKNTQDWQDFHFQGRNIVIAALGAGSSLRGIQRNLVRPDTIIMDDMQSREEAESEAESASMLKWLLATLLKANNKLRCQFTFVGNMYPFEGSILKKLKHNPGWVSFITGAILEDGQSIWPELRSVEDLIDELESDISMGHPEIFFSEVMNDEEAGSKNGADISKIAIFDCLDPASKIELEAEAGFIIIDPSVGKRKSDNVAIGAVLIYNGRPVLREVTSEKLDPKKQISECFRMAVKYGIQAIVVESVAYQATLAYWMRHFQAQLGFTGLRIIEIFPKGVSKVSRIFAAVKLLTAAKPELYLHPSVRTQFVYQLVHWNPTKPDQKDDLLDIVAYIHPTINEFGPLITRAIYMPATPDGKHDEELELGF